MFRRGLFQRKNIKLTKATRLQLGAVQTEQGTMSTLAGNSEHWGNQYYPLKYPIAFHVCGFIMIFTYRVIAAAYGQYRDMLIFSEHICIEDVWDRAIRPIPGLNRIKSILIYGPQGMQEYRAPTPLTWLPYEMKLGSIRQSSL